MITDQQARRLRRLDVHGVPKEQAAARAGMDPKTARKYRRLGRLPSEVKRMDRDWLTRPDAFADVWPQLEEQLRLYPRLQAKTLLADLRRRFPGRFSDRQLRTLQRRVKRWRALQGPAKEVFFAQVHHPGRLGASDFTHGTDLGVTINGSPFVHLIYHFVLTYSNWETGTICFSESLESLSEGLQNALWELGGVPAMHRTDRLTAAIQPGVEGAEAFQRRYQALLGHYGLQGQAIQAGKGNENGDVEQSHRQFKRTLDQALMLRGSRDFASREDYTAFLRQLFGQANGGRHVRLAEELALLRPLPAGRLEACKRLRVRVETGSTIRVEGNIYSVCSRLIGEWVEARLYAERVEVWYAQKEVEQLPRLRGRGKHRIDYRHVIDWLVRKPGAFADYRYQADLFPSSRFRMAYDALRQGRPQRAAKEYLRILYLAARESEVGVEAALAALLDGGVLPEAAAVAERLRRTDKATSPTEVVIGPVDLSLYDALLESKEVGDGGTPGREGAAEGVLEGTAPAGDAGELRGAGPAGPAGGHELRAVPAGLGGAGVPGAAAQAGGAVAARLAAAAGEELAGPGPEASAGQGGAAGPDAAGGLVPGPPGERAGLRAAGLGENPFALGHRSRTGAGRSAGAVRQVRPAGAAAPGGQEGSETDQGAEAVGGLPGIDRGPMLSDQ
jgi:hypothetical protein